MDKPMIVAAAIRNAGVVWSVAPPGRHHDVIRKMADFGVPTPVVGKQGFIASDGNFYGRIEARKIADAAGQLLPSARDHIELFSEDVW